MFSSITFGIPDCHLFYQTSPGQWWHSVLVVLFSLVLCFVSFSKLYLEDLSGKIFLANLLHEEKNSATGFHWYYALSLVGLDTRSPKILSSRRLSLIIRDSGLSSILKVQAENCERNLTVYRRDSLFAFGSPDCLFLTILPLIKRIPLTTSILWRIM